MLVYFFLPQESCKIFTAMLVEVNDASEDAYLRGKAKSLGGKRIQQTVVTHF